jgi:hypothetical protein
VTAVILQSISLSPFYFRSWECFFLFQRVKLDATCTEAARFIENVNAEEIPAEQSAEFYSCEIYNNSFPRRNFPSGNASASNRETSSRCEMCDMALTHKPSAMRPLRDHERPFACNVCNKIFTRRYNLDTHRRVHTGERPFSCKVCKKPFSQRSHLMRHLRVHSGELPFSCEVCKKMFSQRTHLKSHLRIHSGKWIFPRIVGNWMLTESSHPYTCISNHKIENDLFVQSIWNSSLMAEICTGSTHYAIAEDNFEAYAQDIYTQCDSPNLK